MQTHENHDAEADTNQLNEQAENELDTLYGDDMVEQITLEGLAEFDNPEDFFDQTSAEIYSLASGKIKKLQRKIERRACKNTASDRRASVRLDENGEPQKDRRAVNRAANIEAIQKGTLRQTSDS